MFVARISGLLEPTSSTVDFPADLVQAAVLGCVLVWISPTLALTTAFLGPLLFLATAVFGRRMRGVSRSVQAQLAAKCRDGNHHQSGAGLRDGLRARAD